MQRQEIDLNEDTFANNEELAATMANQQLHDQMNMDNRVPSSLQTKGPGAYN
jgi:hypothetical protein